MGCLPSLDQPIATPTMPVYQIQFQDVSVEPGIKIVLIGTTSLPEGNCVYTQLVRDSVTVDWWPVGKCFPVSQPEWSFSIPLGVEGAPENLDPEGDYCIRVWWPGAPSVTLAEYHFSLAESVRP